MLANFVLWRDGADCVPGAPAGRHRGSRAKAPVDVRAALEGRAVGRLGGDDARRRRGARRPRTALQAALGMVPETMALARDGDVSGRSVCRARASSSSRRPIARARCSSRSAATPCARLMPSGSGSRFAPASLSSPRRRRTSSSRRRRTGTCWAASTSGRAATPGRRSSRACSTSAGSRSGYSSSTPRRTACSRGRASTDLRSATRRAARWSMRPRRPDGGSDLLAVVQLAAVEAGALRLDTPDGPALTPLPLPYSVPPPTPPRGRIGTPA